MSDFHEFRRRSIRRRAKRRMLVCALAVLLLVALAVGGWFAASRLGLVGRGGQAAESVADPVASSETAAEPTPEPTAAPALTGLAQPSAEDANWNRADYAVRTLDMTVQGQDDGTTAMDYRLAAQMQAGVAELTYFDNVTFMGDSLTAGLQLYATGLPNAHYCAYIGAGPNAIVNRSSLKRASDKQPEVALDALAESLPNQIYVLYGTNVLVRDGDYSSFLAYYSQMLDMIHETVPMAAIYVESITPVRPELRNTSPGLYSERLQRVNDELAALALQKGCCFIDLWEVLADENGDLKAEYAAGDGYHLKPDGYSAWVEYLRTHTAYTPGVAYQAGTSYYIEQ